MLTDVRARTAKPREKPYKLADQGGLYLYVSTRGGKSWRFDYRLGKRQTLTLGPYPETTLAEARERHLAARKCVGQGMSPAKPKASSYGAPDTFQSIAEDWYSEFAQHRSVSWQISTRRWLTKELFPAVGGKDMRTITPADILAIMRRLAPNTANLVRMTVSRIFQHAIRNLRAEYDPAQALRGAVVTPQPQHHAALTAKELPGFLAAVDAYHGRLATKLAVRLLLLTVVRKGELLGATWDEVGPAEWRIPPERMKGKILHIVPLSAQAAECFRQLQSLARGSRYVLPHFGDTGRPMGRTTLNTALESLGYAVSPHGLRATASTILNEAGFAPDIIERQLAHTERNRVRAAYNRAEYLEERRRMMQAWADTIDALVSGANVILLRT